MARPSHEIFSLGLLRYIQRKHPNQRQLGNEQMFDNSSKVSATISLREGTERCVVGQHKFV